MIDEFDICGTHIPYSEIKDYQIVQREYIYRPAYKEKRSSVKKLLSSTKYDFTEMIPYASVLTKNDDEYKLATKDVNTPRIEHALIKDVAVGVFFASGNKLNRKKVSL